MIKKPIRRLLQGRKLRSLADKYGEFTRIGPQAFVRNLEVVDRPGIPDGAVVECGVWRGGMIAAMAELLGKERSYYLFDSFEGLPPAEAIDGQQALDWMESNDVQKCKTEERFAREAMELSGVKSYDIMKGWFEDSLPSFVAEGRIAVLRLDADWYSSTMECLNFLYPQVVPGGLIVLDDYFAWDGCARAVHDFLSKNRLIDRISSIGRSVAYLVKSSDTPIVKLNPHPEQNGRES